MNNIILPMIHLNGTAPEDLREGYHKAWRAVNAAAEAVAKSCPNGRDYYPLGDEAFKRAVGEHYLRLSRITEVMDELAVLMAACDELAAERDARRNRSNALSPTA